MLNNIPEALGNKPASGKIRALPRRLGKIYFLYPLEIAFLKNVFYLGETITSCLPSRFRGL
jgi:hypothetical protein